MSQATIAFGRPLPDLEQLDDAAFLRAIAWKSRDDRAGLARAAARGDARAFSSKLRRSLRAAAKRIVFPPRHCVPASTATSRTNGELRQLLDELCHSADASEGPELVALWRAALVAAIELSLGNGWPPTPDDGDSAGRRGTPDVSALVRRGELPWRAGLIFRDVAGAGRLRKAARRCLERELLERTDAGGLPQAELLPVFPEWFGLLVRAASWGKAFDKPVWSGESRDRFAELTRAAAALCDRRGWPAIAKEPDGGSIENLPADALRSAAHIAGWKKRRPAARLVHALANGAASRRPETSGADRPQLDGGRFPSRQSDVSRLACLRTDWSLDADVLVLAHHARAPELRLSVFGTPLLSGPWTIEVAIDGRPVELGEAWNCVCWASDGDGDYLELQQKLPGGLRIERQAMLAREDRLLVVADVISGAGDATIEYSSRLPLADGVAAASDRGTRECGLRCGRLTARAFPLALPDDRILSTPGSFVAADGLELRQTARGGLYAPLVLDWHPQRKRGYADWRTLTVAEDGRRVTTAEGWGHRLRVGELQLLVYRSLSETRRFRTILGQHTAYETLVGRFDSDGEVEAYVMVESAT
ncbi:MAG TPA: hypothetical protein VML55_19750 [Planctomycetaceae bacterium]|nr:hypothetical protein [Planctomycetaceae bacterium]